jgi:hypothetical protein
VAIESEAGLTDSFIAHLPIVRRGRPGHEKTAPSLYLIEGRAVHLFLTSTPELSDSLAAYIPIDTLALGPLVATVLTWDPAVMPELIRRGASGDDFLARLDEYIRAMPGLPDSEVRATYAKFRRFYFAHAHDPVREAPFLARLSAAAPGTDPTDAYFECGLP